MNDKNILLLNKFQKKNITLKQCLKWSTTFESDWHAPYLRVIMWPLAQKQAKHNPWFICTTSARKMKDASVILCL